MNTTNITSGRIVQYMDDQHNKWPAMITKVDEGELTLTVFNSIGTQPGTKVSSRPVKEKSAEPGSWWWPVQPKPKAKQ